MLDRRETIAVKFYREVERQVLKNEVEWLKIMYLPTALGKLTGADAGIKIEPIITWFLRFSTFAPSTLAAFITRAGYLSASSSLSSGLTVRSTMLY
jgi:hypothetical protein